ncbi:MAG: hypothetical protein Q7T53_10820 [Deltaproteobacteria bacterium]|nr:hypothetical protein [Deltaproteobacteria bacterium]
MATNPIIHNRQRSLIIILSTLFFLVTSFEPISASEPSKGPVSEVYYKQVATVLKFYDVLSNKESQTVRDFFELFGKHNEAELELGLSQDYQSFKTEERNIIKEWRKKKKDRSYAEVVEKIWHDNPEAKKYADDIYEQPDRYLSRFLKCIRSVEPLLFSQKTTRTLEFPPRQIGDPLKYNDFIQYYVWTSAKKVIFEFSPDEVIPFLIHK